MSIFTKNKLKHISDQVIVITGASSGIGLATAISAAKKGARVVLVSRNENALAEAQRKIEDQGGEAIYVVADVAKRDEVQNIVDVTVDAYGGFDTWVNCAGVGLLGRLDEVSDEDNRRLFDTNFWGIVYGSLAAAQYFSTKAGAIINLGSLLSDMSVPLQGMYSATKHAVKGFTDAFRNELQADGSKISVTLVKPAAIATPFFTHAKNYTTQEAKAPPPVYAPEEVAYAILHAAQNPVRDVRVGGSGAMMSAMNAHTPRLMDWINEKIMMRFQLSDTPKSRHKDNLHDSGHDGSIYGKNMPHAMTSVYTRATLHPVITSVAITAIGAVAYAVLGRKTGRLGKTALTGLNLIMPLQNAVIARGLQKFFESKSALAADTIRSNSKTMTKAVNENAKLLKEKTIALIK